MATAEAWKAEALEGLVLIRAEGLVLCVSPSGLTVAFGGGGSSPSDGGRISKDLVVVQADGVTLVCPKDRAQDIKQMVVALREKGGYDELL